MSDDSDPINEDSFNQEFTPIRDYLVSTAVNFLLNPDVQRKNDDSKVKFLKRKGLTDAEISAAFEKAKFDPRHGLHSSINDHKKPILDPHTYQQQPYSFWSRLSGFSSSLIVFGVALYGLHYFYKKYIKLWMLGEENEETTLNNNLLILTENLTALTDTVGRLQAIVAKQNEEINKIIEFEGSGFAPTPIVLEDIKRDISSLKSILISRHQFPAVPQLHGVKATIPSWQLPNDSQSPDIYPETENSKPVDLATNTKPAIHSWKDYEPNTAISDPIAMIDKLNYKTPETSLDLNNGSEYTSPATNNLPNGNNDPNNKFPVIEEMSNDVSNLKIEGENVASGGTE